MESDELTVSGAMPPRIAGKASQKVRTVVVDDSDSFLQVVSHLLDLEDVIDLVAAASDGVDAVDTVLRLNPDLVVMDVNMPGLDGLSAASVLAEMSVAPKVVLMSAEDSAEIRRACERAGVFGFVHKANFQLEFEAVLEHLLGTRDTERRWART